jgi:hypothetical protein
MIYKLAHSFASIEFVRIFLTAFAVLFVSTVCRYATKAGLFSVSHPAPQPEQRAAHFDCLRIGADLALLGLVGVFSVCEVALPRLDSRKALDVHASETLIVIFQVALLLSAVVALTVFDSPEKSFKRGIFIPNLVGWISVMISVALFYVLTSVSF